MSPTFSDLLSLIMINATSEQTQDAISHRSQIKGTIHRFLLLLTTREEMRWRRVECLNGSWESMGGEGPVNEWHSPAAAAIVKAAKWARCLWPGDNYNESFEKKKSPHHLLEVFLNWNFIIGSLPHLQECIDFRGGLIYLLFAARPLLSQECRYLLITPFRNWKLTMEAAL